MVVQRHNTVETDATQRHTSFAGRYPPVQFFTCAHSSVPKQLDYYDCRAYDYKFVVWKVSLTMTLHTLAVVSCLSNQQWWSFLFFSQAFDWLSKSEPEGASFRGGGTSITVGRSVQRRLSRCVVLSRVKFDERASETDWLRKKTTLCEN